jgi:hypothetical protein
MPETDTPIFTGVADFLSIAYLSNHYGTSTNPKGQPDKKAETITHFHCRRHKDNKYQGLFRIADGVRRAPRAAMQGFRTLITSVIKKRRPTSRAKNMATANPLVACQTCLSNETIHS